MARECSRFRRPMIVEHNCGRETSRSIIMRDEETQGIYHPLKKSLEERALNLLGDSKVDQDFSKAKSGNKRIRKHYKLKWMLRKPMAIPELILELQDECLRESALRCLSNFLLEKREDDPVKYDITGYMLYFSCSTMTLLLQEVLRFLRLMTDNLLTIRALKRFINVLTLFQCIAANNQSKQKFVHSLIPNYLIPVMLHKTSLDGFENVRAIALSVFGILCQGREPQIIKWALKNNLTEALQVVLEIGNELSKVIGMHIIEAILRNEPGLFHICSLYNGHLLENMMRNWDNLIHCMSRGIEFSPRLQFHILRCYVLLCVHPRGLSIVRENVWTHINSGSFTVATEEFPVINNLLKQLLLIVDITERQYSYLPEPVIQ